MKIVITLGSLDEVRNYMDELCERYDDIVLKYNRYLNTITLINGDIIKGYSAASRRDGIIADAAMGIDAEYITCRSKLTKRVWESQDLINYLDRIRDFDENLRTNEDMRRCGMFDDAIFFKKLRDASEDVIKAYESNDVKEIENALGRFMLLMIQFDALK